VKEFWEKDRRGVKELSEERAVLCLWCCCCY